MKRMITSILVCALAVSMFAGCTSSQTPGSSSQPADGSAISSEKPASNFKTDKEITVVSREDGSGTRGAFVELFGVELKDDAGNKKDMTTKEAIIANKTDIMLTNIANDDYAIGYVSLGSLNDSIKALDIDGVKASAEQVKNGNYKISRPFNIVTSGTATGLTKDFIDFILSKEGQEVVVKGGYIAVQEEAVPYAGDKPAGKIVVAGSSSVTPIMEKLKEAYLVVNTDADIQIQMTDSTAGVTGTIDGTCDIGMVSRALKDAEKEKLTGLEIALDGIAVIVSTNNSLTNLSKEDVKKIYTGEATTWGEVIQ